VAICLEDNGPGIDPDQLQSIFEPLTTTKEDGMGMGLAISRSIVQAHGGEIWAENNPNGGIRFHLTIPAQR
jgi:two-component system sensor kinase FixL